MHTLTYLCKMETYTFPNITVLSTDTFDDGRQFTIIMRNSDEGYVPVECIPTNITIDRYYLERWHQARYFLDAREYKKQL